MLLLGNLLLFLFYFIFGQLHNCPKHFFPLFGPKFTILFYCIYFYFYYFSKKIIFSFYQKTRAADEGRNPETSTALPPYFPFSTLESIFYFTFCFTFYLFFIILFYLLLVICCLL